MNEQDFQERWTRFWKVAVAVAMGLALVANALAGVSFFASEPEPEIVARSSYSTNCYMEQGGSKFVAASGCEIELQSGATFDLQSGATTDFSGGVDLDGSALTWDPTGGTTSQAATDNFITTTIGAATGKFSVLTGNLVLGNGSPDTALNGEDTYLEGTLEVDGAVNFDGAVDIDGALTSATGALTVADTLQVTGVADFDAGMTFGPTPLYPLGINTASQEIECGTTTVFTGSVLITPTTLNTPTYVLAMQVTAPTTTAAYLYASDPTTTTFTLTSLENDFTAGTSGIQAHYCAIGTE